MGGPPEVERPLAGAQARGGCGAGAGADPSEPHGWLPLGSGRFRAAGTGQSAKVPLFSECTGCPPMKEPCDVMAWSCAGWQALCEHHMV